MLSKRGFTLIELVLVIGVISIFFAVVSMSAAAVEQKRLYKASVQIRSDLRYAQRMALYEKTSYQLLFNERDNYYSLRRKKPGYTTYAVVKTVRLSDGVKLKSVNASGKTVNYSSKGTTTDACTIALETSGYAVDITVNLGGAGRVEIKEQKKRI